jgi:hypothetical protein
MRKLECSASIKLMRKLECSASIKLMRKLECSASIKLMRKLECSASIKFSEFSKQPNVVCLLLMLGCTTVLGGDLGLGILKPIIWSCLCCSKIHIYPPNNTRR